MNIKTMKVLVGASLVATTLIGSVASAAITSTLKVGSRGAQVKELQQFLNGCSADTIVAASGAGSAGYETTYFGPATKKAVIAFQKKMGISQVGQVGPATRAAVAAGCGNNNNNNNNNNTTGSVNAMLASDTPAATMVPDAANANFTKFMLSASSATNITSIYVTRGGLSDNTDVENIKILDENMVQIGSAGSLNSNNKAQITFSPALTVNAGSTRTLYIRAGVTSGSTHAGKTVTLGIASASDIVANGTVGGSFPITGNTMSTIDLSIGTVTIDEDGTVSDSQPDGGDTDVVVNKFKLTAGSVEGVTIKQIALERQGTASATDTANIELYDVSKGTTVGTVATWDAGGLVTFNGLNMVLEKGETRRFEVRVDILSGSSLTVNADLTDGSDVRVQATGNSYGFYITPTNSMTNGQGASSQTIQSGAFTVTKSASTPATGNIAAGSDVHLATFDVRVQGEASKITSFEVNTTLGTMVYSEVTNVKLINADTGAVLAGPKDLASDGSATFTDVVILPVGVTKVKVTGNIATSVSASDTIKVDIDDASTEIVVRGMSSNDSITPAPASAVSGNTMTVQAATLAATTLTNPAARSIVKGQQDFVFAIASLSAANSGEDVSVTALVVENSVTNADADAADIDNVEIWADLTSSSSSRGDVFETLVSTTKQFAAASSGDATLSFTLSPMITVPKNGSVNIAVIADLSSDADTSDTHTISLDTDSGDVTANGKSTGSSITLTPSGAGQAMTVAAGGTLTVSLDSTSPNYVAGLGMLLDTSSEQTTAVFRLAANNTENLNVDSIKITDDGTNGNDVVSSFKFYDGATLLGSVTPDGSGNAEIFLVSDQLVIPANGYKLVTVKAVLNDIDGTGFVNADSLEVTIDAAGDIDTTGKASGSAVDSTQTSVDAATYTIYEAYPVVSFLTGTDTSDGIGAVGDDITLGSNQLVAKIKVSNPGNKDVTFQSGDSSVYSIQVTVTGDDTDTANETITLKDQYGTTLDTGTISSASGTTQIDFDMSSVGATVGTTIPAGLTRYYYIYADTSDLEDATSTIQISLDDTAADVTFGIEGSGAYTEGDVVNIGDPTGPLLNYPN